MGFGVRYMREQDFLKYAGELGLIQRFPPWPLLLEFLERERLLLPVARVRFPETIARTFFNEREPDYVDPSLETEPEGPRLDGAAELWRRLQTNHGLNPWKEPLEFHPFDLSDPSYDEFIERDVGREPYVSWEDQQVLVGRKLNGEPKYDEQALRHHYHYWQVFVLAELFTKRWHVLNRLEPEHFPRDWITKALFQLGDYLPWKVIWPLLDARRRKIIDQLGDGRPLVWRDGFFGVEARDVGQHVPALDAVGVFVSYRSYYLLHAGRHHQGAAHRLEGDELQEFYKLERASAVFALRWKGIEPEALLRCIEWQCERWTDWRRYGPPALAKAYTTNIVQTAWMYRIAASAEYEAFLASLSLRGRQLFNAVVPDRVVRLKDLTTRSLPSWVLPSLSVLAPVSLAPSAADCHVFADWLAAQGLLQFFFPLEQLADLHKLDHRLKQLALAKSVESMSSTIEHMLNAVMQKGNATPVATLKPKMNSVWGNVPAIVADFKTYWDQLAKTFPGFSKQQTAIRALALGHPYEQVVRVMLEVGLIRNQGTHVGYPMLGEDDLRECMGTLVQAALLIWMHARSRGWA